MNDEYIKDNYNLEDLINIVHKLRQPDGCSWDNVQTYESMKSCVINEANEVVEAVENKDFINLKEELGDLLLQVVMYSDMARDRGEFTFDEVVDEIACKMVRRHPHVFGDENEIETQLLPIMKLGVSRWNAIKLKEKESRIAIYEQMYREGRISRELLKMKQDSYEEYLKKLGLGQDK